MADHDLFLCYAWEHKRLADELREALENAGLDVFQDEPGMSDFEHIGERIDAALRGSRNLLALYTPGFWRSEHCRYELHFALLRSYALHRSRLRVLAVVKGVEYDDVRPSRLKNWRLPAEVQSLAATAREIARHVRGLAAAGGDRRLGDAPVLPEPEWFPRRRLRQHLDFHGREQELWAVHDLLFPGDDPAAGGQVVAVTGPAGIGKTMLVEQYARLFARDCPGGVFVLDGFGQQGKAHAGTAWVQQHRDRLLHEIARSTEHEGRGEDVGMLLADRQPYLWIVDDVGMLLADRQPYLWIVDDVPVDVDRATFESLLAPTAQGRTLLTSRRELRAWVPRDQHVELAALSTTAALSVLTSQWRPPGVPADIGAEARLRRLEEDRRSYAAARQLVDELAGYPLALTLAAGLVGERDFTGFDGLLRRVTRRDGEIMTLASELDLELPTDRAASIAATIGHSLDTLPGGLDVLRLTSLGAPAPVPEPLLAATLVEADALAPPVAESRVAVQLELAEGRFLAQRVTVGGADGDGGVAAWQVHPLVSRVVRVSDHDTARREQLRRGAVVVLTRLLDKGWSAHPPATLAAYLPHVDEIASAMANVDDWHLLNEAGKVHGELGSTEAALRLYQRLYDTCRTRLGEDDTTTLAMLVGLGVAHGLHGDHRQARELKERALRTLTARLGPDNPDTLTALNNLAVTYDDLGDHQRARDTYEVVHRSRDEQLGSHHPDTLEALMNLSIAVGRCGDHAKAERMKREVLKRFRAVHGDEHPRTLDAANNLAASLVRTDRTAAHELFLEQAEVRRRLSGESADTAGALENAAATAPDWPRAAQLMDEAYQVRMSVHGPEHPLTRRALGHLLVGLLRQHGAPGPTAPVVVEPVPVPADVVDEGKEVDADDERIRLLDWATRWYDQCQEARGPDHPETMRAVCYMAHAHALLGQRDEQVEEAWVLIDDAATGLALELGERDLSARLADRLRTWIAAIGSGTENSS